jgi:hypothetical protein
MFYVTVSVIELIILVVMLYSVYNKISSSTPPLNPPSVCPDYWYSSYYDVTGDPIKDAEQMNLASYGDELDRTMKCYNVKKLGSKTCSSSMDFSGDEWNGSDALCKKQKWAKACGLTWDGVTTEFSENCR